MDRRLKERLVGAVVLVAIGVLVVPEFLSGPARREDAASGAETHGVNGSSLKTYEIRLGSLDEPDDAAAQATGAGSTGVTAPPRGEQSAVTPSSETKSQSSAATREGPQPSGSGGVPAAATRVAVESQPTAVAGSASTAVVAAGAWAVQAGSFANRSAAQKLAATLEKRGYPAFVMPFSSGSQTLYRVRVGPMEDRSDAEATLRRLASEGVKGAVVANP